MTRTTTFHEVMDGAIRLVGEEQDRPLRLELDVTAPGVLRLWGDTEAVMTGRAVAPGWAVAPVAGTMRIAPVAARRIRYRCAFETEQGRRVHFDGWKSVTLRHLTQSMTTLPFTVADDDGQLVGQGVLRFDARRDLGRFLAGFRYRAAEPAVPAVPTTSR
jgi:hypothetical protein